MNIGPVRIAHPFTLAPLEEHSNYPFRQLMRRFGTSLVVSERVDAAGVAGRDRRAMRRLYTTPAESPRMGQLSSADPAVLAEAARVVAELGFELVDLNFDCPVRRLVARGEGGALMADPPAIARLVAAAVRAVSIPVTLKIRSGPDAERETAAEVARRAEEAGAQAVSVHARSVAQGYAGGPDWGVIARVRQAVRIPVIGSGGVREAADALRLLEQTAADAVAVGRGCLGNPWIFRQAVGLWSGGGPGRAPTAVERGRALVELVEGEFRLYGSPVALRRLPRTAGYFAAALPRAAEFRQGLRQVRSLDHFRRLVREFFR
jgi:nifR3 family TIM-barrel protein